MHGSTLFNSVYVLKLNSVRSVRFLIVKADWQGLQIDLYIMAIMTKWTAQCSMKSYFHFDYFQNSTLECRQMSMDYTTEGGSLKAADELTYNAEFFFYHNLAESICSEINGKDTTFESLEVQLANNNHDQFIDISYS